MRVKKDVTLELNDSEVSVLVNICEMASRYIQKFEIAGTRHPDSPGSAEYASVDEWNGAAVKEASLFTHAIFDI